MRLLVILLGIVLVVSFLFLGLSYVSPFLSFKPQNKELSTGATLSFKPQVVYSDCNNSSESAEIFLNSQSNSVVGAQIELSYNPNMLYDVTIQPTQHNFFGAPQNYSVVLNETRAEYGRVSYAVNKMTEATALGDKSLAVVSFRTFSPASESSTITFLNKSTVQTATSLSSILNATTPLTIQCQ